MVLTLHGLVAESFAVNFRLTPACMYVAYQANLRAVHGPMQARLGVSNNYKHSEAMPPQLITLSLLGVSILDIC
jgi:hypothetical protein